jgi:multisubunit Na+/H+ antiporter MnhB subunit
VPIWKLLLVSAVAVAVAVLVVVVFLGNTCYFRPAFEKVIQILIPRIGQDEIVTSRIIIIIIIIVVVVVVGRESVVGIANRYRLDGPAIKSRLGRELAQLVEVLRYKPGGRGFHTRWCH